MFKILSNLIERLKMSPKMKPNHVKILESILYLIDKAQIDNSPLTQYGIVKCIFTADYNHLNRYGRPVTFDNISAFEFGPAPSTTYDFIKNDCDKFEVEGERLPLWESKYIGEKKREFFNVKRKYNNRKLSVSDIRALDEAYEEYKVNGFDGTFDWTHELEAYKKAWRSRGFKKSNLMDYSLLLKEPNPDLIDDLVFISRH